MVPDWLVRLDVIRFQRRFHHRIHLRPRRSREGFFDFLRGMAAGNGFHHLVVKEVFHDTGLLPPWRNRELFDDFAGRGWPVIGIIRDPSDTVDSTRWLLSRLLRGPMGAAVRLLWPSAPRFPDDLSVVRWAAQNWADFVGWARQRGIRMVRYEDLALSPQRTLFDICKYVGIPYDDGAIIGGSSPIAFTGIGDPDVILHPTRPIHHRTVGRGRSLARNQFEVVRSICEAAAADYGYEFPPVSDAAGRPASIPVAASVASTPPLVAVSAAPVSLHPRRQLHGAASTVAS